MANNKCVTVDQLNTSLSLLRNTYCYPGAGSHNAHYRGVELTWDSNMSAAIQTGGGKKTINGTTYRLFVGDNFTFSNVSYQYTNDSGNTVTDKFSGTFKIVDFDYFRRIGDTDVKTHHIVVMPLDPLFSCTMNDTATTEGGYVGSKLVQERLQRAEAIFVACFGADHIFEHREYLYNAVSNGKPSGGGWYTSTVELPCARQLFGGAVYEGIDGLSTAGVSLRQFSAFKHRSELYFQDRKDYWVRDIANAKSFVAVYSNGNITMRNANVTHGVRPYACII